MLRLKNNLLKKTNKILNKKKLLIRKQIQK